MGFLFPAALHEKGNRYPLADIEHILVGSAVGAGLLLQGIAVQVEDVNGVKGLHQALAHASKGGIVQIAVIRNHPHDAASGLFDLPLGKAQELDIIVLKAFRVLLH